MNLNFWIIVIWLVGSFAVKMFDKKRNYTEATEFCERNNRLHVIDASYDSVPNNYCPSCGPKLNWED